MNDGGIVVAQVQQKTVYQCILACIESIARGRGIALTQDELIRRFPQDCNVGVVQNGAHIAGSVPFDSRVPFSQLESVPGLARLLKLSCVGRLQVIRKGTLGLSDSRNDFEGGAAILILPRKNRDGEDCRHCVRLDEFDDPNVLIVMNPSLPGGDYDVWDWQDLDTRECEIVVVSCAT